ncbi:hypothetical protein EMCRGX_G003898 [Ephydatia muelleri]
MYPFCPNTALDPLGHHAVTCRHGEDVVIYHNRLRDEVFNLYRCAVETLSYSHGSLTAMGPTLCYGTHLVKLLQNVECDPLDPLLFSLALHKLVSSIDADDECFGLLLQTWYLDDGVLAGSHPAELRAVDLLEELGPALGIHINLTKCEIFGRMGNTSFPPSISGSFCKLVHLARTTPPSLSHYSMQFFDEENTGVPGHDNQPVFLRKHLASLRVLAL